jgi:hypothetical protein
MKTILIAVLLLTTGCANMNHGSTQAISINSYPQGAVVTVDPQNLVGVTPTSLVLKRKYQHVVHINKEGFLPASVVINNHSTGEVWKNIVWVHPIGWIIGGIIDLTTGANKELDTNTVNVTLTPTTLVIDKPTQDITLHVR